MVSTMLRAMLASRFARRQNAPPGRDAHSIRGRRAPPARAIAVAAALAAVSLAADGAAQTPPTLEAPIRCAFGRDCLIQFHPDVDTGADIRDYRCGRVTYDTHRGTDIRVPTMRDVRRGVEVLAAAAGVVGGTRDGEPDIDIGVRGRQAVVEAGKSGGNLVVLDHGEGWTTHYWHLRQGSVRVRRGDRVAAGDVLGLVGLSGDTNFPHLHFEVRLRNRHVDPFTGFEPSAERRCGAAGKTMWSPAAAAALAYRPAGIALLGVADRQPDRRSAYEGSFADLRLTPNSPVFAVWFEVYGLEIGDRVALRVEDPAGGEFLRLDRAFETPTGFRFDFAGRQRRERAWAPGVYRATLRVIRPRTGAAETLAEQTLAIDVR